MFLVSHQDTREEIIAVMDNGEKKQITFTPLFGLPIHKSRICSSIQSALDLMIH